ncbi:MAG TPA: tetratricopeptide repeat protein, partial [Chthoniobacterales bacterium]|nr:tetratricopeptide repeat protein [Chthoniobacterales bacterium]
MAAFQAGDYAKAAADLETVTTRAELSPQLEPAFYTIGSAYFNAGEYAKAIAAFKNYQAKFPSGPHISDVKFGIAQASLGSKNYADAAKQFSAFESDRRLREQALLFQATAWRQAGKIDQAIVPLEKLASGDLKTASGARCLMMLAQLYADKGEADKVVHAISTLHEQRELVDNIVELNATTVAIGDQLFARKLWERALECYRAAYPRDQVVRMQNERIARMQRAVEANLAAALSDRSQIAHLGTANSQLKSDIAKAQQLLADFQKLPDFTPAIYIRMARSF